MLGFHPLVARPAAVTEIVPVDDALALEQPHGAVDCRQGNPVVDLMRAAVHLLDVGMVAGRRKHARNDSALRRHAHTSFGAECFDFRELLFDLRHDGFARNDLQLQGR